MNAVLLAAALAVLVAYVCRLDHMTWRRDRWRWALTAAGGGCVAVVMHSAGTESAAPSDLCVLLLSVSWLVCPWSWPVRPDRAARLPWVLRRAEPPGWIDEGTRFLSRYRPDMTRPHPTTIATRWEDER